MKKLLFLMTGLMFVSLNTMAQKWSSDSSLSLSRTTSSFEGINSFYFQYDAVSIDEVSLNGIGVGYTHSWGISSSDPVYVQSGIGFQYAFGSKYEIDYTMYSFAIPVNIGYQFQISDRFALAPYLGFNVRYYLGGKMKYYDYEWKLFDSDEGDCNAFAFGWQIGVKATLSTISLGLSYGTDFTEIEKGTDKIGSFKVTLGINF